MIGSLSGAIAEGTLVVSATKGIETDTLALMSQVFAECLPANRFAAAAVDLGCCFNSINIFSKWNCI